MLDERSVTLPLRSLRSEFGRGRGRGRRSEKTTRKREREGSDVCEYKSRKEKKRDRETQRDRACAVTVELRSQVLVHGRNGRIDLPSSPPSLPPSSRAGSSNGTRWWEKSSKAKGKGTVCNVERARRWAWARGSFLYQVTEIYTSSPKRPPCNNESDKGNKHRG